MNKNTAIGIRVSPKVIYYSIINDSEDEFEIIIVDKLIVPAALRLPEQLKFIRSTFIDILNEFRVKVACLRVTESSAQTINRSRIGIEAVIQELMASSTITNYFTGQISSISAKIGFDRNDFCTRYKDAEIVFNDIESWGDFSSDERESLLAAFSALKL